MVTFGCNWLLLVLCFSAMSQTLLTTAEMAAVLRVHPKHMYRLLRRGLPGRRLGGEWRFIEAEVIAWMRAREPGTIADSAPASAPPLLVSNGDVAVERVLAELDRRGIDPIGWVPGDCGTGLDLLRRGRVMLAGVHGPGEAPLQADNRPARVRARDKSSDGLPFARIELVQREVGLASNRRRCPSFADVPRLRIASRPPTAPMRGYLEGVLRSVGAAPGRVLRTAKSFASHRDVVLAIVRGEADVGVTTAAWAERGGLSFRPITTESYGLLVRAASMSHPTVVRLCEALQSVGLRRALRGLRGYDTSSLGRVVFDPAFT